MKRTRTYHNAEALSDGAVSPRERRLDALVASTSRAADAAPAPQARAPKLASKWTRQGGSAGACAACRGQSPRMWRCREQGGQEIVLCEGCKLRAFDASFGAVDVARLARPTPIESNRQRH